MLGFDENISSFLNSKMSSRYFFTVTAQINAGHDYQQDLNSNRFLMGQTCYNRGFSEHDLVIMASSALKE